MSKYIIETFCGFCPEFGQQMNIDVKFVSIPILGKTSPEFRKISFSCEHYENDECKTCEKTDCPIFLDAAL